MTKYVNLIYLILVLLIVVFIQIGIRTGQRPDMKFEGESEGGFKPMAQKIKEAKALMEKSKQAVIEAAEGEGAKEVEMVFIPPGKFVMGDNEGHMDQHPEREVFLKGFFIDRYEVTFAQYYSFMALTDHREPRLAGYLAVDSENMHLLIKPLNAVAGVDWNDAYSYCQWKGKRLLTEAEWEKAAKGDEGLKWPWGNEEQPGFANLVGLQDGFPYLSTIGGFKMDKSPYGIYDMAGNVMEWVSDWYQEDYYGAAPASNPTGPQDGDFTVGPGGVFMGKFRGGGFRVVRGASWNDSIKRAQTAIRFKAYPTYRDVTIGFRCAKDFVGS